MYGDVLYVDLSDVDYFVAYSCVHEAETILYTLAFKIPPPPFIGPALKLFPQLYLFNAVARPCSVAPFVPVLIKLFKKELLLYCRL